jgi:hypothetical protein
MWPGSRPNDTVFGRLTFSNGFLTASGREEELKKAEDEKAKSTTSLRKLQRQQQGPPGRWRRMTDRVQSTRKL